MIDISTPAVEAPLPSTYPRQSDTTPLGDVRDGGPIAKAVAQAQRCPHESGHRTRPVAALADVATLCRQDTQLLPLRLQGLEPGTQGDWLAR
jgi:hypothetical protein